MSLDLAPGAAAACRDLNVRFGLVQALKGVTMTVPRGCIMGLVGPNGAGKTTLMRVLTGLEVPESGQAALGARLAYVPDFFGVYPRLTVREYVGYFGELAGWSGRDLAGRMQSALERTGLASQADRMARRLSRGYQQRLGLAGALVREPELLLLDEPASGLDPVARRELKDLLLDEKSRGRTIIISSHILSELEELCDHVAILDQGRLLYAGTLDGLLRGRDARVQEVVVRHLDMEAGRWAALESSLPGVTQIIVQSSGETRLRWAGHDPDRARLIRALMEADVPLTEIIFSQNLETGYLSLCRAFS